MHVISKRRYFKQRRMIAISTVIALLGITAVWLLYATKTLNFSNNEDLPLPIRFSEPPKFTIFKHANPGKWHTVEIKRGDSLTRIFQRHKIPHYELHVILSLGKETAVLAKLLPGEEIYLFLDDKQKLQKLVYRPNLETILTIKRNKEGELESTVRKLELENHEAFGHGVIENSLFHSGAKADLPDKLIAQMVKVFQWDIDFARDVRPGDTFNIIYDEYYVHGEKVKIGNIVAAEFVNNGKRYRAVRYEDPKGNIGYYTPEGRSLKRQFSRTPVKFTRISSHFTLKRWHPILHRFKKHTGVDYAAPSGTPVKATSNGRVAFVGVKGGYGNAIILQHGKHYSTLYGHLKGFAKKLKKNSKVKQGQVIGYVGMTGWATGPHLHYEFRIDGKHRNPLTVKLPQGYPIPQKYREDFRKQTQQIMAKLELQEQTALAACEISNEKKS